MKQSKRLSASKMVLLVYLLVALLLGIGRQLLGGYLSPALLKLITATGFLFFFTIPVLGLFLLPYVPDKVISKYETLTQLKSHFFQALGFHIGIAMVMLSFNQDIFPTRPDWNIGMSGLGVALVAISFDMVRGTGETSPNHIQKDLSAVAAAMSDVKAQVTKLQRELDRAETLVSSLVKKTESAEISVAARLERNNNREEEIHRGD